MFRTLILSAACVLLVSCTDSKEVNSAFAQTRVSWFLFDTDNPAGLYPLSGFEQAQKVTWQPRNRAVFATDLAAFPATTGAAAVSGLGLLLLDDADGILRSVRPGAQLPLTAYRTDRLFFWRGKLFLTLTQESPAVLPPASLAWWAPGQNRLAFYPVPSQITDPTRQAVAVQPPAPDSNVVVFLWRQRMGDGWAYQEGTLDLSDGTEGAAVLPPSPEPSRGQGFDAVKARLAERLGAEAAASPLEGPGTVLLYTEAGWVSVARNGEGRARLYRLPDLGTAGRYTKAISLKRGFVFAWETSYRGYSGAAGLVHVPFAVLAP